MFLWLLCCLSPPRAGAATPTGSGMARREAADGVVIGELLGPLAVTGEHGKSVGAYTVLSAQDYRADVLPSGELAGVSALVYPMPGCKGAPFPAARPPTKPLDRTSWAARRSTSRTACLACSCPCPCVCKAAAVPLASAQPEAGVIPGF